MLEIELIKILLVEDDEDDFIITRELLAELPGNRFKLDWARTFDQGLERMLQNQHDICLLDYRLGAHNGVELLRTARQKGAESPVILLTTSGQHTVDVEAMDAGASDYLVKGRLDADRLERSIRYAVQRKRAAAAAAFEQARLAAFGADIGLAMTRPGALEEILDLCAQAMVKYLNAGLAQIATFESADKTFAIRASAGAVKERGRLPASPIVLLDSALVAQGKPMLIKQLVGSAIVSDAQWVRNERMVSYAACPLVLEDKLVGLMSIFTEQPLPDEILQEMGSVAHGIALCIERKRSKQALDLSEHRYRALVESIHEVIFRVDAAGKWTFLNRAWTTMTGFGVSETLGTPLLDYIHRDDQEYNRRIFLQLVERKLEYCRHETRYLTKDGKVRWVEFNARLLLNGDGEIAGASGSLNDITERKLAETQVQKLAAFPRVNPNPVLEFAADGTLTYANDAAWQMARSLGHEEVCAILPGDADAITRQCLVTGRKVLRKQSIVRNRTLTWSFFPVADSPVVHCYGADITDVLSLEAQFRQAQKMECVGQLAAGVAHDINNILTVIQGRTSLLLNVTPPETDAEKSLKQISSAAERAARFIRQLLMFSRKQVIQTRSLDLSNVISNLESMLLRMLGEDIALETACPPDSSRLEGDVGMIEQVLMNLVVNARDAMPRGGKLLISTASVQIDETYAGQHGGAYPGRFVCLVVADTGCGMDSATLERVFEPFFTTKDVGKGTGLGLATVYGIVRQHKGWIDVQSEPGRGTTFRIYLPASSETAGSSTDFLNKGQVVVAGGNESILVVEDEDGLRELVQQILREYHYQVSVASTGNEALRIWKEAHGKFDLLLTDVVMPGGMTGRELAEELKKDKAELKVIFTSGYNADLIGQGVGRTGEVFLSKPYMPPHLARVVRECLDAPRTPPQAIVA